MDKFENEATLAEVAPLGEAAYLQDKAAVDIQISTARAFPRSIERSLNNAIAIATMDKETAESCTYTVPRGGKNITGPSVHLAKILAQCWGNMRIESRVVGVDDKSLSSSAVAWDLENNLAIKAEIKRSIMTKVGRMNDDMIVVTGNAGNAIALRNAVLSVIPKAIVDKVHKAAQALVTGDVGTAEKLQARRVKVFERLKEAYDVSEKEILSAVGKQALSEITVEDINMLIGIGTAINDGDTSIDEAFRTPRTKSDVVDKKKADLKDKGANPANDMP